MHHGTFDPVDLAAFAGLEELGLHATGQRITASRAFLECRLTTPDPWCTLCGCEGIPRGTRTRRLAHAPFGHRPTTVILRIRRYTCSGCGRFFTEDTTCVAEKRAKLTRVGMRWALQALVVDHLTISRVAAGLGVSWHTANTAVLAEGKRVLIDDPARFDGVQILGVDEHVWRHTRGGDKYVTVIIDLTPVREKSGPARLLDMVPGRSKDVFKTWLADRPTSWRDGLEVIAMDGFTGFKTAAAEEVPTAQAVMDPFHVVRLAGDAVDQCRRRVQNLLHGRRGRKDDPLYKRRRTFLTGWSLLTDRQKDRLRTTFDAAAEHVLVEATWGVYQRIVDAYRDTNKKVGKVKMSAVITDVASGVPSDLREVITLGRTLKRRREDVVAFFDHPGSSNGPTEAINGRLEHLRGSALGFRNLTNYIARSLLEAGGFRPVLHTQMR